MRKINLVILSIIVWASCYGQSKEEKEIVDEGKNLYKSEMASWYGTDIFLSKFGDRRQNIGGYFSYLKNDRTTCVFFSKGETPKIIGTFSFDSTYDVNTAIVDGEERESTKQEFDLLTIRQAALKEYRTDSLFKSYKEMNPNFIPVIDEKGKRVYVVTGPQKQGIVVLGNDYLLTFDKDNKLKEKKRIHKSIIIIEYGNQDGKEILGAMHTHLPETGDLITPTDICTLMLYQKEAKWAQHYVLSERNVSVWDCRGNQLTVMTKKAWEKIYNSQSDKKKK